METSIEIKRLSIKFRAGLQSGLFKLKILSFPGDDRSEYFTFFQLDLFFLGISFILED